MDIVNYDGYFTVAKDALHRNNGGSKEGKGM